MSPATARIEAEIQQHRKHGARIAAMILLAEPDRIQEPISDFLRRTMVEPERVRGWLRRAGVCPLLTGCGLSTHSRRLIAGQLVRYSKAEGS